MTLLKAKNLVKTFGSIDAVDDVSFSIKDREFISIVGPSGSGKTTILRMLAGFENPTEGSLYINDESILTKPPFERDLNMVFQDLALFPHLDVSENIKYGLKQKGIGEQEQERAVKESLEMVHLSGYEHRGIDELSGGEQQRIALARAIVNEPEIVLFDEPLASLDRKLRQHMKFELQRIQEETGITFLYVTHDQEIALSISDRIIVLNDGSIEQIGKAEGLYENPTSKFVSEFIGDINVFEVTIHSINDSETVVEIGGTKKRIARDTIRISNLNKGEQIWGCVRPESISYMNGNSSSTDLMIFPGEVVNKMYLGDHREIISETTLGEIQMKVEDGINEYNPTIGEDTRIGFAPNKVHWFKQS